MNLRLISDVIEQLRYFLLPLLIYEADVSSRCAFLQVAHFMPNLDVILLLHNVNPFLRLSLSFQVELKVLRHINTMLQRILLSSLSVALVGIGAIDIVERS